MRSSLSMPAGRPSTSSTAHAAPTPRRRGHASGPADGKAAHRQAGVAPLPLLDAAMRNRRYPAALALGRLPTEGGDPFGIAYEAAALVELGRDDEARALAARAAESSAPGLGREVAEVLALRSGGPATIVRDRAGRLLGRADGAGNSCPRPGCRRNGCPPSPCATAPPARRPARGSAWPSTSSTRWPRRRWPDAAAPSCSSTPSAARCSPRSATPPPSPEGGTPAFDQQREPASIQKLITATAAMRAGLDPDAEIARMTCGGSRATGAGSLWCPYPGGRLAGLGHALAISCNVAFANLGLRIGRAALLGELRRFGFDSDAPGAGRIRAAAGRRAAAGGPLRRPGGDRDHARARGADGGRVRDGRQHARRRPRWPPTTAAWASPAAARRRRTRGSACPGCRPGCR